MKVFHRYCDIPSSALNGITLLGNFDGVHKGHQDLLAFAHDIATNEGKPLNLITFEPHPRRFFNPHIESFRITPMRNKIKLLSQMGVDNMFILHFTKDLCLMNPKKFIFEVLVKGIKASHIIVGENYRFAKECSGDINTLIKLGNLYNFSVTPFPIANNPGGDRLSSSAVRLFLRRGDIESAENILGHPWEIEGRVIKGRQLGRTMGFPTANIKLKGYINPRTGVYAVRVGFPNKDYTCTWHNAVANFGTRPTVNGKDLIFESHIFNWDGDIYGKRIVIRPVEYLRPEMKIQSIEKLKQTINEDKAWAQIILS